MSYDFDRIIDRTGFHSLKWTFRDSKQPADTLPLWVADMDFAVPPAVADAVSRTARHRVYGYTIRPETYYQAVQGWMTKRFRWKIERDWILFTPGVVPALNFAVQAFTEPDDAVIVQPPVYYPFFLAVKGNGRRLVHNRLVLNEGGYVMDISDLRSHLKAGARMLILCSPHNPVGRVWTREELRILTELCQEHETLIISDEIHADLVFSPHTHTPTAALDSGMAELTVTCTSPSKTFNTAGLQAANIIIPHAGLRKRFHNTVSRAGIEMSNIFAGEALIAAYTRSEDWLSQLLVYLQENFSFLRSELKTSIPEIELLPLEGTYLAWLDCRRLEEDDKKLKNFLLRKAGVWLDEGSKFGPGGEGFLRMNIACPRKRLEQALKRTAAALKQYDPLATD